jgi:glycosyltransferase involved in cell wall biosynthesis
MKPNSKNIIYLPPFDNENDLNDQISNASWYLSCIDPDKIYFLVNFPIEQGFYVPDYYDCNIIHSYEILKNKIEIINVRDANKIDEIIDSSQIIMNWNENEKVDNYWKKLIKEQRRKNKQIWNVDKYRQRFHGSYYIKVGFEKGNYPEINSVIKENMKRFEVLCSELDGYETANLFLSGPMSKFYKSYDCDDGLAIVCNSVIFDEELLENIKPKIICFGDPIFHFGVSRYASAFREKLQSTSEKLGLWIVVPFNYYRLFIHHFPHLKERTIGIPFDYENPINTNLKQKYYLNPYSNILTMLMLPLATTLARNVHVIGADGRKISNDEYFWNFNPRTQINDKMDNIKVAHPAFFNIDYNEYYFDHIQKLSGFILEAEKKNKVVRSLSPSLIPSLRDRYVYKGCDYENEYYPLVSIIMPCHNNGDTIEESVDSILTQDYKNFEIVIVNEGSDDSTRNVLNRIESRDTRIKIFHKEKNCAAAARNYGIIKSNGEYIGFLDSDDIFYPASLRLRMESLILNNYDVVYCTTQLLDETLNRLNWTMTIKKEFASFIDFNKAIIHISSLVIKKTLIEQHMFDEDSEFHAVEDLDLYQRIARTGVLFFKVVDAETGYRQNTGGAVFSKYRQHSDRVNKLWDIIYKEDNRVELAIDEYKYGIGNAERIYRKSKKNLQTIIWLTLKNDLIAVQELSVEISPVIISTITPDELKNVLRAILSRYYRTPLEQWEKNYQLNQVALNKVLFENLSFTFSFDPNLHPIFSNRAANSNKTIRDDSGSDIQRNVTISMNRSFSSGNGSCKSGSLTRAPVFKTLFEKKLYFRKILKTFDGLQYVKTYPDVLSVIVDGKIKSAFEHFVKNGNKEGRQFVIKNSGARKGTLSDVIEAYFDGMSYLENYPDVRDQILKDNIDSARSHYEIFGRKEGREIFVSIEKDNCAGTATDIWEKQFNNIITKLSFSIESERDVTNNRVSVLENQLEEMSQRQEVVLAEMQSNLISKYKSVEENINKLMQDYKKEKEASKQHMKEMVAQNINGVETEQKDLAREVDVMKNQIAKDCSDLNDKILRERQSRLYYQAENESSGNMPKNILIILSVQRSGSTWLMDSIRTHPSVYFEPMPVIHESLKLNGGRYPTGLANTSESHFPIIQNKGRNNAVLVPEFQMKEVEGLNLSTAVLNKKYAIEKIHSESFNFECDLFVDSIKKYEEKYNAEITFIYQIRDPIEVIRSFLGYQKRDNNWYSRFSITSEVVDHIKRSFESLLIMAKLKNGYMVDYKYLSNNYMDTVTSIFDILWGKSDSSTLIAEFARDKTERNKRIKVASSSFLKKEKRPNDKDVEKLINEINPKELESIYDTYNSLIKIIY